MDIVAAVKEIAARDAVTAEGEVVAGEAAVGGVVVRDETTLVTELPAVETTAVGECV